MKEIEVTIDGRHLGINFSGVDHSGWVGEKVEALELSESVGWATIQKTESDDDELTVWLEWPRDLPEGAFGESSSLWVPEAEIPFRAVNLIRPANPRLVSS